MSEPSAGDAGAEVDLGPAAMLAVSTFAATPSAVVAASLGAKRGAGAAGRLWRDPDAPEAHVGTVYDLASVTKPIVALAFARLERRGVVSRREHLADVLPLAAGTSSADVPLDLLLAHRSGLEAHIKLFAPLLDGRSVERATALDQAARSRRADASGPIPSEGFAPVYSDMGYLLLGAAIEARVGAPLDAIVDAEVLAPLGLSGRIGSARQLRARGGFDDLVAPTEDVEFRGGVVRGSVHDENAFAISSDGLSGHAGLFGDARAVRAIGEAVLASLAGASEFLRPDDLAPLVRDRPGGTLLAGFDRRGGETPSSGARLGPRTFGHLGFTGTSIWIDPDAGFVGVLLTNRVHPSRDHIAIRAARPVVYDSLFDLLARRA